MESTTGYVYILINPSYEGLVKIGKTTYDRITYLGVGEVPKEEEKIFKRWLPRLLQYAEKAGIYTTKKNSWGYERNLKFIAYLEYLQTK